MYSMKQQVMLIVFFFETPILMYTGLKQLRELDPDHYRSDTLTLELRPF